MRKNTIRTRWPVYELKQWSVSGKLSTYHTIHKNSFLLRLNGLSHARRASFTVGYGPESFNESIDYQLPEQLDQMKKDARIFTAREEVTFIMDNL